MNLIEATAFDSEAAKPWPEVEACGCRYGWRGWALLSGKMRCTVALLSGRLPGDECADEAGTRKQAEITSHSKTSELTTSLEGRSSTCEVFKAIAAREVALPCRLFWQSLANKAAHGAVRMPRGLLQSFGDVLGQELCAAEDELMTMSITGGLKEPSCSRR